MLNRQPGDRSLPTLVTLLVIGVLLMTFDVRAEGGGVSGVLRSGTQTIVAPLQKAAAFVVNPVVDLIDSVSNIATLREQNIQLQRELAEAEAALVAVDDELALNELYERIFELESTGSALGRTVAQVIAGLDGALFIDKGSDHGIVVGQPVIDESGYVVGTIQQVTAGTAIVVPITVGPDGVAVTVGDQQGVVLPQVFRDELRLEISEPREPVLAGQRVVTSSNSVRFPAGYPVGEVMADADQSGVNAITTQVRPFTDPDTLRLVVILAWPPDPVTAVTDIEESGDTTTTTIPEGSTTTSTVAGDS